MTRISILTLGLLALAGCSCSENTPAADPANVILITMDTTRADYLSSYGYKRETTPHMDQLAREGVRFARAMSTSAVTPVSHASILTGLYQHKHGVRVIAADSGFALAPDTQSFATVLKKRGYELAAIHSAFPVSKHYGFDQGYDLFESLEAQMTKVDKPAFDSRGKPVLDPKTGKQLVSEITNWDASATRRSEVTTDLALEYLDRSKGPFFLWLHYWDPHDANAAPPEEFLDRKYLVRTPKGYSRTDDFYAEEVRYVDSQLGRLFAGLKERGLYDNSLIILTADHGEGLSDGEENHGWKAHRELYVEQINVPLIWKFPKGTEGFEPGSTVERLVGTVDLLPTACDYLDMALPPVSGSSLRDVIEGRAAESRLHYADQINGFDTNAAMTAKRPKAKFVFSMMNDDWKLIYRPTEAEPKELYNIANDPRELRNVVAENPERVNELMIALANQRGWVTGPFLPGGVPATNVNLNGLGYVAAAGTFEGDWEWVCPIGHEHRVKQNGECPECGHPLVPVAIEKPAPLETGNDEPDETDKE